MLASLLAVAVLAHPAAANTGMEPPPLAAAECRSLAASSRAQTLIVGFEGLLGYEAGGVLRRSLLAPTKARHPQTVEYVDYPSFSLLNVFADSSAESCALAWKSVPGKKLIIVGHSYGGQAASSLAHALGRRGVVVDDVITLDPRPRLNMGEAIYRSRNVRHWRNFYRQDLGGGLQGWYVPYADQNTDLAGVSGHVEMPTKLVVHRELEADLAAIGAQGRSESLGESPALAQARAALPASSAVPAASAPAVARPHLAPATRRPAAGSFWDRLGAAIAANGRAASRLQPRYRGDGAVENSY